MFIALKSGLSDDSLLYRGWNYMGGYSDEFCDHVMRKGVNVLDTETGVIWVLPVREAVRRTCNLQFYEPKTVIFTPIQTSFICDKIKLAYDMNRHILWWGTYEYDIFFPLQTFTIIDGRLYLDIDNEGYMIDNNCLINLTNYNRKAGTYLGNFDFRRIIMMR